MASQDGRQHLVFNGEILNYRQLRAELPYPYRTNGDTEVLLAVYQRHGPDGVTRLRGQFAYALHDMEKGETHLWRDRLGILPLYYYFDGVVFAFASEIKALLPILPGIRVDEESLHAYLAHRSVPAPYSMLEGVHKVPQGHRLVLNAAGQLKTHQYWNFPSKQTLKSITSVDSVRRVDEALNEAVREAMVADVPVGAYLSGGVDSSLIAALASRANGARLCTYAAGFGDQRVDELSWARKVSKIVGSDHHEVLVSADDFRENWMKLSWHRDGPLSEPADVAVYKLAQLARRDVKVILSGEGSDELFAGYPKHRFARATWIAGLLPAELRVAALRVLEPAIEGKSHRLRIALRAMAEPSYPERMRAWFAPFTTTERSALLARQPTRDTLAPYRGGAGDSLHRLLFADVQTWLADNLLERGDRMSMAASLELRPPFLDHRLVELAFHLPSSVKVRRGVTKWVVKEVARQYLPDEVVDRAKIGFRVPLDAWFRSGLRVMARDLLTGPDSFVGERLDRRTVANLLAKHETGDRNEEARIWTLLSLEVWHREITIRGKEVMWPNKGSANEKFSV